MAFVAVGSVLMRDNKNVYSTVEFDRWVDRSDLDPDEHFVITHFLDRGGRTLEAGTGGGRILRAMRQMGFTDLHGFDFVPGLVDKARVSDGDGRISFEVQDATRLAYPDSAFDQVIYFQQLLCFIDDDVARASAVHEAFRVLRPGGVALFSVLSFEVRRSSPVYRCLMRHWRLLRWLRRSPLSPQAMPWMRLGDRFNPAALLDHGPYVYWFRLEEFVSLLQSTGFVLQAAGSSRQIRQGQLYGNLKQLEDQPLSGGLYFVFRKPSASVEHPSSGEKGVNST